MNSSIAINLFFGFLTSLFLCKLIIATDSYHGHLTSDNNFLEPQKIHVTPIPRIGGISIFIGITIAMLIPNYSLSPPQFEFIYIPFLVLIVGASEDLFKKISPRTRLVSIVILAFLEIYFNNLIIKDFSLPALNRSIIFYPTSILITTFAITGLTNAYNIIDGLNGLSSLMGCIALIIIAIVSYLCNDNFICNMALIIFSSIFGFVIFNFPRGTIFLGDGGAYLIGFLISILSISLVNRNLNVSPFLAIIVNLYPITETLFSIYRRKFLKNLSISNADRGHLHSLVYRRVTKVNSMATIKLLLPSALIGIASAVFYKSSEALILLALAYLAGYLYCYKKIIQFKL